MKKETLIQCIIIIVLACILVVLVSMEVNLKKNTNSVTGAHMFNMSSDASSTETQRIC